MTTDVLKELGIKRYRASVDHKDHSYEEPDGWPYVKLVEDAEKGDLVFAPTLEAAIRRGDLIPRSRIQEVLDSLGPPYQYNVSAINVLQRLLKGETKHDAGKARRNEAD